MHVDAGCRPPLSGRRLRGGSDFLASPSMREWSALPARPAAARCKPRLRRAAPFHFAPAGAARRFSRPLRSLSPPTPASGEAMGLLGSAGGNRWFSPSNRHFGLDCQDMSPSSAPHSSAHTSASRWSPDPTMQRTSLPGFESFVTTRERFSPRLLKLNKPSISSSGWRNQRRGNRRSTYKELNLSQRERLPTAGYCSNAGLLS